MPLVLCGFDCGCGCSYEDLIYKKIGENDFDPVLDCPECGRSNHQSLGVPNIGAFSAKNKEERVESLRKRSEEHSKKLHKKNEEKFRHKISMTKNKLKG